MVDFLPEPVELGHVTVSPIVAEKIGLPAVIELLGRHVAGDRGDLSPELLGDNVRAMATRQGIVSSVYRLPAGVVLVLTELAPSQTSVIFAESIP